MSTMLRDFFIIFSYLLLSAFRPVPLVHAAGDTGQSNQTRDTSGRQCGCSAVWDAVNALSSTISSVSVVLETNTKASEDAKEKILALERNVASVQQELTTKSEQYETSLRAVETAIAANFSSFVSRQGASNSQVGFTARFSYNPVTNVGTSGTYVFDDVVTNVGNGYNAKTGAFTAPETGLYALFLKFMSTNDNQLTVLVIVKNGTILGYVWGAGSSDPEDQSSTLVTTFMEKGQQAWVRHYTGATAVRGREWTEFTGFLVQAQ